MLTSLHVQNFAIIDQIDIDFKSGLTVLTGETGAGKSLIIDAIGLLIGGKSSPNVVRNGAVKAVIEGVFDHLNEDVVKFLTDLEIDNDDELIIRRDIYATGKTTFRVNGIILTASQIELLCENLVDIHVQNDTLRLFNPKNYLSFIDNETTLAVLKEYQESYLLYLEILGEYKKLLKNKDTNDQNLDYIKFQLNEITSANLVIGEEESLLEELKLLNNYENIFQALQNIKSFINNDNLNDNLYEILENLKKLKLLKPNYIEFYNDIENTYYLLEELNNTVKSELSHLEYDEDRVNEINERLSEISRLKRKYRLDVDGILSLKENLQNQIDSVDNFEFFEKELNKKLQKAYNNLKEISLRLTKERLLSAKILKENILSALKDLMLDKVRLEFVFNDVNYNDYLNNTIFNKNGVDTFDILISFNPGETLKPLSKVASGGEMSRVMLALKTHLFKNKKLSTVIFDEIDTGISGSVAEGVARKIKEISTSMQVLSITHLPIVAAIADNHLFVKKSSLDDSTTTTVVELSIDERINNIAEMISPNDNSGKAKEVAEIMLTKK